MRTFTLLIILQSLFIFANAQKDGDESFISKLREEGLQHSQVMDHAFYLTDVSGPRLTASTGFMRAATWAKKKLESWGLKNVQIESWGEFGKSWQQERCYVAMTKPYYMPIIAQSIAWTGSTPGKGITTADVVLVKARDSIELQQYAGKLRGKVAMVWRPDTLKMGFNADATRLTTDELEKMTKAQPGKQLLASRPVDSAAMLAFQSQIAFNRALNNFYSTEKPSLILNMSRGTEGTIFIQGGFQPASRFKKALTLVQPALFCPAMIICVCKDWSKVDLSFRLSQT
jgi:biotin operon repressor